MDRISTVLRAFSAGGAHGALLSGSWAVDKRAVADGVAAAVLGVPVAELARQMGCVRVGRLVDEKTGEKKKLLTVALMEELLASLALMHDGPRVAIVEDIDCANSDAQHRLLRILEEPPARTVLLLLAEEPERVLSTVRSRVVHFTFAPTAAETATALAPLSAPVAALLAAPRSQRLLAAAAMTKGEEAQAADALAHFFDALAHTLHSTFVEKYATMSPEQRRAHRTALARLAAAPSVLRENASPVLLLESIVLALP